MDKSTDCNYFIRNNSLVLKENIEQLVKNLPFSKNKILIKCLEIGSNTLLKNDNGYLGPELTRLEKSIQSTIKFEAKKIIDNTKIEIMMLQLAQQMQSSILQELEYLMQTQDVVVPEAALERFRNELPASFKELKNNIIQKIYEDKK